MLILQRLRIDTGSTRNRFWREGLTKKQGGAARQTKYLDPAGAQGTHTRRSRIGQHHNRLNCNHDKSTQQSSDGPRTVLTFVVTIAAHKTSKACVIHRKFWFYWRTLPGAAVKAPHRTSLDIHSEDKGWLEFPPPALLLQTSDKSGKT